MIQINLRLELFKLSQHQIQHFKSSQISSIKLMIYRHMKRPLGVRMALESKRAVSHLVQILQLIQTNRFNPKILKSFKLRFAISTRERLAKLPFMVQFGFIQEAYFFIHLPFSWLIWLFHSYESYHCNNQMIHIKWVTWSFIHSIYCAVRNSFIVKTSCSAVFRSVFNEDAESMVDQAWAGRSSWLEWVTIDSAIPLKQFYLFPEVYTPNSPV